MSPAIGKNWIGESCTMRRASLSACNLLITVFFCGLLAAEGPSEKKEAIKPASSEPEKKAATQQIEEGAFRIAVSAQGVFEPSKAAEVVFKSQVWTNLVVERSVPHGKIVKKDEPLVWLETTKIDDQIRSAERSLQLSQIALQEGETELKVLDQSLTLDTRAAERAKKLAEDDLKYFVDVTRPRSEQSAEFSLQNARFQLEYDQEELKQLEKMYKADDLTEETEEIILKRARRAVESSKFFLEQTLTTRDRTIKRDLPRQFEQLTEAAQRQNFGWEKSRVALPAALKKKKLDLERIRTEFKKSAEDLGKLKRARESMIIRSPLDGVVYYGRSDRGRWPDSTKLVEKLSRGGLLLANQPIMTVVALRPLNIRIDLAEKDLQHVRVGTAAKVTPTSFPFGPVQAKVAMISSVPIAPSTFDCQLRVEDKGLEARIAPGMTCSVTLVAYENPKALMVPPSSVFADEDQRSYVYLVQADGKHVKHPVGVGKRTEGKVEIVRGLKAGDKVLLQKPSGDKE